MDVYRQAAGIVEKVSRGNGTAKALCLQKQMQKKKQTYAVVCETLRNLDRIKQVLEDAEFFEYYPALAAEVSAPAAAETITTEDGTEMPKNVPDNRAFKQQSMFKFNPKFLIYCMAYDHLYGKGINTRQHPAVQALQESKDFLFQADAKLPKAFVPRSAAEKKADEEAFAQEEANQKNGGGEGGEQQKSQQSSSSLLADDSSRISVAYTFPRYARINRLLFPAETSNEEILSRLQNQVFRRSGVAIRRERNDDLEKRNNNENTTSSSIDETKPKMDQHLPGLIVFPPGTDLHAHPLVKQGKLLLQDKASCLPAAVLCDLVPSDVVSSSSTATTKKQNKIPKSGFGYLVDGCSAPGNKTTQLAEYTAESNYYGNIATTTNTEEDEKQQQKNEDDADAQEQDQQEENVKYSTKVIAVERDPSRFKLLKDRMSQLTQAQVQCRRGSFEEVFEKQDIDQVGAILLDPSCSSSGVLSRIDQQLKKQQHFKQRQLEQQQQEQEKQKQQQEQEQGETENKQEDQQEKNTTNDDDNVVNFSNTNTNNNKLSMEEREREKVKQLAEEQLELLVHALTQFPKCKRVVYSTCSIHQAENENVVLAALDRALKHKNNKSSRYNKKEPWRVTRIMPSTWATRGRFIETSDDETTQFVIDNLPFSKEEREEISSCCIRCDPFDDKTSGFFVARFDRD